jgi:hypothetical protein
MFYVRRNMHNLLMKAFSMRSLSRSMHAIGSGISAFPILYSGTQEYDSVFGKPPAFAAVKRSRIPIYQKRAQTAPRHAGHHRPVAGWLL